MPIPRCHKELLRGAESKEAAEVLLKITDSTVFQEFGNIDWNIKWYLHVFMGDERTICFCKFIIDLSTWTYFEVWNFGVIYVEQDEQIYNL